MFSYITEPFKKYFSAKDANTYKRKRKSSGMIPLDSEEGEPDHKRSRLIHQGRFTSTAVEPRTGSYPFGIPLQDWFVKIKQMAAKPIMSLNIGQTRNMDDCAEEEEDEDSDIEILEPPTVNGGEKGYLSQALTREPLHSDNPWKYTTNGNGKKAETSPLAEDDSEDAVVSGASQNGTDNVPFKKKPFPELDEFQSEDSSPESVKPQFFRRCYSKSKAFSKSSTPLESIRLGEKEQYRMLLEQYKAGAQVVAPVERPRFRKSKLLSAVDQRLCLPRSGLSGTPKLSDISKKPFFVEKLSLSSGLQNKHALKENGTKPKNSVSASKYLSLRKESTSSNSIVDRLHPKQLDYMLQPSASTSFDTTRQKRYHITEAIPTASAKKEQSVRPKNVQDQKRNSMPAFEKEIFSQKWLKDLQFSLDDSYKARAKKEEKLEKFTREMREKREAKIFADNRKSLHRLAKSLQLKSTDTSEEEEDTSHLLELTPEMQRKIDEVLRPTPPEEVLCEGFRLSIARRDMETLSGLNWLNDEIINFYMNLLMERGKNDNFPSVYAFNTFFYPKLTSGGHSALKRWTRQVDIFSYHYVLIPVHLGMHWCLAVIDFKQKKIQYYDSMGGQNNECVNALKSYLQDESRDKKKTEFDMSDWKFETVKNIPQQMNGSDCGMFTLKYAESITRNAKITFSQRHMPYFRRRMVYEIVTKTLL